MWIHMKYIYKICLRYKWKVKNLLPKKVRKKTIELNKKIFWKLKHHCEITGWLEKIADKMISSLYQERALISQGEITF